MILLRKQVHGGVISSRSGKFRHGISSHRPTVALRALVYASQVARNK